MNSTEAIKAAERGVIMGLMSGRYVVQVTPCGATTPYEYGPFRKPQAQRAASAKRAAMAVELMGGDQAAQKAAEDRIMTEGGRWQKLVRAFESDQD